MLRQLGDVLLLELHVGVQQGLIALAAAPEHVAPAAQLHGQVQRLLHLRRGKAEHVRAVGRSRPVHEPRVAEHVRRAPQAPDVRALHLLKDVVGKLVQPAVRLFYIVRLGHKVHVMEAEVFDADLPHEFKSRVHLRLRVRHRSLLRAEALVRRVAAEHIRSGGAEIVPPRHRKRQVLAHLFAQHDPVRVVEFEGEGVRAFRSLIRDHGDACKYFAHADTST